MTFRPPSLPPVPEATVAAVPAAFPKGNRSVALRAELGTRDDDQLVAERSPPAGGPVDGAPWRLALLVVRQAIAGRPDRPAAEAVRRCLDGTYALSLALTDPGFDCTLLHACRHRLRAREAGQRVLESRPGRLQRAGVDQGTGHATDRCHACPGGDPPAPPVGMCPGSQASGAQPAQWGRPRLGAPAHARRAPVRSEPMALSSWSG